MPDPLSSAERLTQLEELFTHQQQLLADLHEALLQLRADQEQLKSNFQKGLGRLESLVEDHLAAPDPDEKPPHY